MEKKVFGYPKFNENGEEILTTYDGPYRDMLMDIRVYKMKPGDVKTFSREGEEIATLLIYGDITYEFDGKSQNATRTSCFEQGPWASHMCAGSGIKITANELSEILVQCTHNDKKFDTKIYSPKDCPWAYAASSKGKFGNVANRQVNTVFDYEHEPYSNMVLGEVLNDHGNWSGYLPHNHPQPEVYYFKFERPEGFGASFVGDEVFKSVDNSFSAIPGGKVHPQAAAPGYRLYTVWMIRHLPEKPWLQTDRCELDEYQWLHDAKF